MTSSEKLNEIIQVNSNKNQKKDVFWNITIKSDNTTGKKIIRSVMTRYLNEIIKNNMSITSEFKEFINENYGDKRYNKILEKFNLLKTDLSTTDYFKKANKILNESDGLGEIQINISNKQNEEQDTSDSDVDTITDKSNPEESEINKVKSEMSDTVRDIKYNLKMLNLSFAEKESILEKIGNIQKKRYKTRDINTLKKLNNDLKDIQNGTLNKEPKTLESMIDPKTSVFQKTKEEFQEVQPPIVFRKRLEIENMIRDLSSKIKENIDNAKIDANQGYHYISELNQYKIKAEKINVLEAILEVEDIVKNIDQQVDLTLKTPDTSDPERDITLDYQLTEAVSKHDNQINEDEKKKNKRSSNKTRVGTTCKTRKLGRGQLKRDTFSKGTKQTFCSRCYRRHNSSRNYRRT